MVSPNDANQDTRITVLETKLDALWDAVERIEGKLDEISKRQMEIDVHAKIAYNMGKMIIAVLTTVFGWLHWDTFLEFLQAVTRPKH